MRIIRSKMRMIIDSVPNHGSINGGEPEMAMGRDCAEISMRDRRFAAVATAGMLAILGLWSEPAQSAPPAISVPTEDQLETGLQTPSSENDPLGFLQGIGRSAYLFGDWWGLRPWLGQYGISVAIQETSELLGNPTGGIRQGADYDGLTQMLLQADTQRLLGYYGGTLNVSALQYHGRSLSADNLENLQTASGIEADRATRLWELWYEQKFLQEDRLTIKVGQQSLDQEFIVNQNAGVFVNTMFGWPMLPSADLPGGGPAYPLSALGVRFKWRPIDPITILAGVFNGSPDPAYVQGDPQKINPSGLGFPLNGGQLAIAELQYSYPSLGTMLMPDQEEPFARVYKIGFWYNTERFADQEFDNTGLSLANPLSTGIPQQHRGDYSIYALADQLVWVDPGEPDRTINLFGRVMGTPQVDRNQIIFSLNAGVRFNEPILHRDDDVFGIGMGYTRVSPRLAALDKDTAVFTGAFTPVQSDETYIEVTYQYEVTPWLQVQPDIQYVFNPGGGLANPSGTGKIGDELVLGVRTIIQF
jgi:porin